MISQPIKWHGGKKYMASWIHSLAPPSCIDDPERGYTHRNIVYAGGMAEFWNWLPVEGISETVNDLNRNIANFYAVLRSRQLFAEFQQLVEATPFSDDHFSVPLVSDKETPAELLNYTACRAWAFFVRYRQSRQGLGKDYATPTTRTRRGMNENVSAWLTAVDGLPECHERLRRVEVRNMDAIKFIEQYDHPRALFYLDPPYLHATRSTTGEYGEFEMTPEQHGELLRTLEDCRGKFMLSGYHSELYDGWARENWLNCHERETDNKASSAKTKEKRVECIWTNY